MDNKICIVCGEPKTIGLNIWGQFICVQCEQEIVTTEVEDEKYDYFIYQLRKLWYKREA